MEKHEAGEMVKYLGAMFPRWKATAELLLAWGSMFTAYPVDPVRAAINQHRANRSGDDPDMKGVRERLLAWREANPVRVDESKWLDKSRGPWRSMAERCERYEVGGLEAWRIDGFDPAHWPAMQEAIECYNATGMVSYATVLMAIASAPEDRPKRVARWRAAHAKAAAKAKSDGVELTAAMVDDTMTREGTDPNEWGDC